MRVRGGDNAVKDNVKAVDRRKAGHSLSVGNVCELCEAVVYASGSSRRGISRMDERGVTVGEGWENRAIGQESKAQACRL